MRGNMTPVPEMLDCPHTIGEPPGCMARVKALYGARRKKVRGGNAQRIFKF